MVIVVPDPGNTATAQRLDEEEMRSLFAALRTPPRHVEIALPRYHATFKSSLVGIFKSMGMRRAFDSPCEFFAMEPCGIGRHGDLVGDA